MDLQEAYAELGLTPGVSSTQLKATWRRLVAQWHPDRNLAVEAPRRMQRINKAYQLICQQRTDAPQAEGTGGAAPETPSPRKTLVRTVQLSLEEAILGCTRPLQGHFSCTCTACAGTGQRVLATGCATCHGTGVVHKVALFGWLWNKEPCADCGGDGRQRAPCDSCDGQGERSVTYRRRVRFPAGVRAGQVLSVPAARHDDLAVDLELRIELEPHPFFTLDEAGILRCEMPVNGYAWMAQRWVDVPTPDGLQQLHLNREALVYRLNGQGFPSTPRGPRGDYIVKVVPVFPAQEDAALAALLEQLIDRSTESARADPSQPLGVWHQQLQDWKAGQQGRASQ